MKKMFKFLLDSHIGAEGGFVQLHTDVNIAIFSLFAPCGGAEKSKLLNTRSWFSRRIQLRNLIS